jgi:PBSX family phage portal protein
LKRDGKLLKVTLHKQYRRFVQQVGSRLVYFKEFGDPRVIDPQTGLENTTLPLDAQATEIFHFSLYSPGSPYGIPRWIGNLPAIMGTRESELTNLQFFKDNAIPAMAILVSGGALTNDTINNIENHFTTSKGRGSMNRVMVLEAEGDPVAATVEGQVPPPRLDIKPLTSQRQTDGLFKDYEEANEKKIRASFRLPPLFVGRSDDYTHATADASMVMADAQVFGPERNKEDDIWNANFLSIDGMPLSFWRIRTNPPRLVSADSVLKALETLDDLGAVTPNIAIGIANELFDLALTPISTEWGNYPFPLVMQLALAGNLNGLQEIMILPDILERGQTREDKVTEQSGVPDDASQGAPQNNSPKKEPKAPDTAKGPTVNKPQPKPAEQGAGSTSTSKARKAVADKLAYHFRSIAQRGNDIPDPMMYKTRKRQRSNAPSITEIITA